VQLAVIDRALFNHIVGEMFWHHPPILKSSRSPRFSPRTSVSLAVSREKDGKLRLVYTGWDDIKVARLGTSPLAEADSGPLVTRGPDPLWIIYGDPP